MVAKLVTHKNRLKTRKKIMDGYFLKGKDKTLKNDKQTFVKQNGNRCYHRAERLDKKRSQISPWWNNNFYSRY